MEEKVDSATVSDLVIYCLDVYDFGDWFITIWYGTIVSKNDKSAVCDSVKPAAWT